MQQDVRRWLSAPDPWTNHNIARKAHHRGTSTWFTQSDVFKQWKGTGRLLWIHGLRTFVNFVSSPTAYISLYRSWLRKDCPLVRTILTIRFKSPHTIYQLIDHRGDPKHPSNGVSHSLHILFRLPGWWEAGCPPRAVVHSHPALRPV